MNDSPNNNIMEHLSEELKEALRALLAGIEEAAQKISKTFEEITDELDANMERVFWRRAAAFARSKMAARAQAFARQMEHQKARQVMKRRKLLHAEGHFPDWARGS